MLKNGHASELDVRSACVTCNFSGRNVLQLDCCTILIQAVNLHIAASNLLCNLLLPDDISLS